MARLRQVPRDEADPTRVVPLYDFLFGDRDPVAEPGTSTGTPGDWWRRALRRTHVPAEKEAVDSDEESGSRIVTEDDFLDD